MNLRNLPAILQTLSSGDVADDAELLLRFCTSKCETAFAEIVSRYGRLVWTVCRHLTNSDADADDAFQATFLVFVRNAKSIREAAKLPAWLHGVACKVCHKARESAKRRVGRERDSAYRESRPTVPDSTWDRALAAVHEEVARLPESQRVPFVLCCLEGRGVAESAERLGLKFGTFASRLARAKEAIVNKLADRGLTLGVVAGVGLALPPPASVAKAISMNGVASAIPSAILNLTRGVIDMGLSSKMKLLAAAVLAACGLGTTVGGGWIPQATGQVPSGAVQKKELRTEEVQPDDKARRLKEATTLKKLEDQKKAKLAEFTKTIGPGTPSFKTAKWDYDLVRVTDLDQRKFAEMLRDRERQNWEYHGTTPVLGEGKPETAWVFRRPITGGGGAMNPLAMLSGSMPSPKPNLKTYSKPTAAVRKEVLDEIRKLENQIAELKGQVNFYRNELPIEPGEFAKLIESLIEKNFEKPKWQIHTLPAGIALEAPKEIRDWAVGLQKKLNEKDGWKSKPLADPDQ